MAESGDDAVLEHRVSKRTAESGNGAVLKHRVSKSTAESGDDAVLGCQISMSGDDAVLEHPLIVYSMGARQMFGEACDSEFYLMHVETVGHLPNGADRTCPVSLEEFGKVVYRFDSENAYDFVEGRPQYCIARFMCNHRFDAWVAMVHMLCNGMVCPLCRAGPRKPLSIRSIPSHAREHVVDYFLMRNMKMFGRSPAFDMPAVSSSSPVLMTVSTLDPPSYAAVQSTPASPFSGLLLALGSRVQSENAAAASSHRVEMDEDARVADENRRERNRYFDLIVDFVWSQQRTATDGDRSARINMPALMRADAPEDVQIPRRHDAFARTDAPEDVQSPRQRNAFTQISAPERNISLSAFMVTDSLAHSSQGPAGPILSLLPETSSRMLSLLGRSVPSPVGTLLPETSSRSMLPGSTEALQQNLFPPLHPRGNVILIVYVLARDPQQQQHQYQSMRLQWDSREFEMVPTTQNPVRSQAEVEEGRQLLEERGIHVFDFRQSQIQDLVNHLVTREVLSLRFTAYTTSADDGSIYMLLNTGVVGLRSFLSVLAAENPVGAGMDKEVVFDHQEDGILKFTFCSDTAGAYDSSIFQRLKFVQLRTSMAVAMEV